MKDARHQASELLNKNGKQNQYAMAFGTHHSALVGVGVKDSLIIEDAALLENPWEVINDFIFQAGGEYVFGYIGFDIHRSKHARLTKATHPAVQLFIPKEVTTVTGTEPVNNNHPTNVVDLFQYSERAAQVYTERIKQTLTWIDNDPQRRATVARRIRIHEEVDFLASLPLGPIDPEISRSFSIKTPALSIMGHSPELLAVGNQASFKTYKLSGTAPREGDKSFGDTKEILRDDKLSHEHANSAKRQLEALTKIGEVTQEKPQVLQLKTLLHILSVFTTNPPAHTSITDCLRGVFPAGVWPYAEGMELLSQIETEGRGAYYGLIGVIRPDGTFEFSQILRSVFEDQTGKYCWVGAAVTNQSTLELELQETCWKLRDCPKLIRKN